MPGHASFDDLPAAAVERPQVQAVVLVQIANFTALRRHVGATRASCLSRDLAERLAEALPNTWVEVAARDVVEVRLVAASPSALTVAVDQVRTASGASLDVDAEELPLALRFGVASGGAHADEVLLSEEAEQALERQRDSAFIERGQVDLAADLRRGIEAGELVLFYQPKIHVRRQEYTSVEALVRWRHPSRGLVLPGDFIAVAEDSGIIGQLTLWTIRQAITDQRRLASLGHDRRIYINVSGQLLADAAFIDEACRLIVAAKVKLGFEVTETSVIRDPERGIANLQRFSDIGVRIAIDDYGAGLSSLAYLKQLPARELKIDKLFVTQLTSSNRDPLIVRSTIDLAHALDMEVVAEGVETHAAMALLTVMGCDLVQGYLISRPLPFDALAAFLSDKRQSQPLQDSRASMTRLVSAWKRA